ncbi:hypothetical protein HPB51_019163 [Rhipicephalus microplus]|uniref:Uncharacterized protein n=1 Tax=Rhipicephalus microplus TaxID=6941 RepID=A0A9J6EBT2_RHIMP|nr:hypothetical protein HPB51_019163 [Rhipicephalus microplus]
MPTYTGYHYCKSTNEYLGQLLRSGAQAHPTFAEHIKGCKFADLEELTTEAKRIQGDILAARSYRPLPPAVQSIEPRCAWNGSAVASEAFRGNASASFADEHAPRSWELSDRALYSYAYALRTATPPPHVTFYCRSAVDTRPNERRNPE